MDMITLAMLNSMKKSGAIGHEEKKRYTFDGNPTGKETFEYQGSATFVKVSDTVHDLADIKSLSFCSKMDGKAEIITEIPLTSTSVVPFGQYDIVALVSNAIAELGEAAPLVVSIPVENPVASIGTWVLYVPMNVYQMFVSDVTFETIHPIDPKFLPDSAKTVSINLDSYGIGAALLGLFAQGGGETTIEDVGDFWDVLDKNPLGDVALTMMIESSVLVVRGVTKSIVSLDPIKCGAISFAFAANTDGTIYMLNAQIVRADVGTIISLKVT